MNFVKKTVLYGLIIFAAGTSVYSIYQSTAAVCDKPFRYSIGRFDSQFGISEADFKARADDAAKVWDKVLDKQEFIYDPEAKFKVNLVYDQRQIETIQKQRAESGLDAAENVFKKIDSQFSALKKSYDSKTASYQSALAAFNQRKSTYDSEVASWNNKGGAPKGVFSSLEEERNYLNSEAESLNREAAKLNVAAKDINSVLQERNLAASEYNKVADTYNKKYSAGIEFNQAEYTGKEINVYQFTNQSDLVSALAHEFGHALGMEHVQNPDSIMYYITNSESYRSLIPTAEDLTELKRVCPDALK